MKRVRNIDYIHDFGGIKNTDGKTIKSHLLFRSANLAELTQEEVEYLANDLNVKNVIDLRTTDEMQYRPETFISPLIHYHPVSLVSNDINPVVTKENRIQVLNDLVSLPEGMRGHILDLYRYLVSNPQPIEGYKKVFKLLLSNNGSEGYLFHCTQGKDRTGIVMLLVLTALGVSEQVITELYLSFNRRARFKRFMYFIGMNIRFLSLEKAIALNDTLTAKKIYLKTALDEIKKTCNSVMDFLYSVIGLTDENIKQLRLIYLK